jgi:hypothetical protein
VLEAVEGCSEVPVLVADLGARTAGAYKPDFPLIFVNGRPAVVRQRSPSPASRPSPPRPS